MFNGYAVLHVAGLERSCQAVHIMAYAVVQRVGTPGRSRKTIFHNLCGSLDADPLETRLQEQVRRQCSREFKMSQLW